MYLIILALPFILLSWLVIDGLRTGVVRMQLGSYSRTEEPAFYWGAIGIYLATIAVCAFILAPMVLPA